MIRRLVATFSACALAGAAPSPAGHSGAETIAYVTNPGECGGVCPFIELRVSSDGEAVLRSHSFHDVAGRLRHDIRTRRFRVTQGRFAAFRATLLPLRPKGLRTFNQPPRCARATNDLPNFDISWRGNGPDGRLLYETGCTTPEGLGLWRTLSAAPSRLGLGDLPGVPRPPAKTR